MNQQEKMARAKALTYERLKTALEDFEQVDEYSFASLENIEDDDEYDLAAEGFDNWLDTQEFNAMDLDDIVE